MRTWVIVGGALVGACAGALLPLPPPAAAPPSEVAYAPEESPGPRLRGSGVPARRAASPAPSPGTPPAEAAPEVPSPFREWDVILREPGLGFDGRMRRLLALGRRFSMLGHHDHAARTFALVDERLDEHAALRPSLCLARAWNDHRRGREREALEAVTAVATDDAVPSGLRADASYAMLLFAYGLGEKDVARRAADLLEANATEAENALVADITLRFGALLERREDR